MLELYSRYCLGLPVLSWDGGAEEEEEEETGVARAGVDGGELEDEDILLDTGDLQYATLPEALAAAEHAAKEFDFIAAGRALANADVSM